MSNLLRIMPYIQRHAWAFWGGMVGLLAARIFEALIPYYLKIGIDTLAERRIDDGAPAQQQVVDALVAMSFPLEAARQAVVLSGATDVQHALASLLDEPPMAGPAAAAVAAPPEQMLGQEEDEMTQEELLRMFGLQASIHKMQADGGEDGFWAAWS